jgi:hypothetical protein
MVGDAAVLRTDPTAPSQIVGLELPLGQLHCAQIIAGVNHRGLQCHLDNPHCMLSLYLITLIVSRMKYITFHIHLIVSPMARCDMHDARYPDLQHGWRPAQMLRP